MAFFTREETEDGNFKYSVIISLLHEPVDNLSFFEEYLRRLALRRRDPQDEVESFAFLKEKAQSFSMQCKKGVGNAAQDDVSYLHITIVLTATAAMEHQLRFG